MFSTFLAFHKEFRRGDDEDLAGRQGFRKFCEEDPLWMWTRSHGCGAVCGSRYVCIHVFIDVCMYVCTYPHSVVTMFVVIYVCIDI